MLTALLCQIEGPRSGSNMGTIVRITHLRPLALSAVLLLGTAPAALALDATDFGSKIVKVWASSASGLTVTLGPATVNGNDVSFAGFTVSAPQAGGDPISNSIKLDFSGVAEQPDGSYTADALTLPDIDTTFDENSSLSVKGIALHHIYVPAGTTPSVVDGSRFFSDASVGPIVIKADGVEAVKLAGINVTNTFKPSQADANLADIASTGATDGLSFDLSGSKDKDSLEQAKALDLVTTTGKMLETVSWTLATGHLNLSELSLAVDKVGKLNFAVDITGYTPQFLETLGKAAEAMGSSATSGNSQAATAMLLASLQSIFLNSASLSFTDSAITNKLLDMGAKQAGTDRPTFVAALVSQIPAQMNEDSQVPVDVIKTTQAAARAYLNDPHSIEVKLAPKTPLGVLGIVAAAMAPTNVAEQIGLKIVVNGKEITPEDAAKETGVAPASSDDSSATPDDSSSDDSSAASDDDSDQTPAASDDQQNDNTGDDSGSDDNSRLNSKHNH